MKLLNEKLSIIKENWKGNQVDNQGRYMNLNSPSERGYLDLLKWQLKRNTFRNFKKNQKTNVTVYESSQFVNDEANGFTWLGHASFFITLDHINIITDPVFYNLGPLKRFTPMPCDVSRLDNIQVILLSHNHRDHMDEKSMKQLCKQNPSAIIYTGLEIGSLLVKWKIKNEIVEAGWYQAFPSINNIHFSYLPAKHWNRRGLRDLNEMLWGSFIIKNNDHCLYFGGDSGIDDHFLDVKKLYTKIDYAFIGIGAYEPNWFMRPAHTSP
ncbi:MAG: hypothetical protein RLZZ546_1270, partial [Bacteroidota bacterium]